MSTKKLDDQLAEFLDDVEKDKRDGRTVANLHFAVEAMRQEVRATRTEVHAVATRQTQMEVRLDRHGRDIRAIKERLDFEADEMDTGSHQIADLRAALEQKQAEINSRHDSMIWWRRQKWQWLVSALSALVILFLTTTFGVIAWLAARAFANIH